MYAAMNFYLASHLEHLDHEFEVSNVKHGHRETDNAKMPDAVLQALATCLALFDLVGDPLSDERKGGTGAERDKRGWTWPSVKSKGTATIRG